jgi:hypothetical protein
VELYCEQCGGEESKFNKAVDGRPLYGALCGMYTVTLNDLKTILNVSSQAGQSVAVNKIQWNDRPRMSPSEK